MAGSSKNFMHEDIMKRAHIGSQEAWNLSLALPLVSSEANLFKDFNISLLHIF
jgi:hypothetical protein